MIGSIESKKKMGTLSSIFGTTNEKANKLNFERASRKLVMGVIKGPCRKHTEKTLEMSIHTQTRKCHTTIMKSNIPMLQMLCDNIYESIDSKGFY